MTKNPALIERLRRLVSLNEPKRGGPYGGYAAEECMKAMGEAAVALAAYERALEYLARGIPTPQGDESHQTLVGIILDMQNFASATLAGVKPISARQMAELLAEPRMTTLSREKLREIFG